MRYEKGNQMSHIRMARIARNKQARARKFLNYCGELPCEFPAKTKVPANYSWCSPDLNRRSDLDAEQEDLEKTRNSPSTGFWQQYLPQLQRFTARQSWQRPLRSS
jgi:hypothetical protein